MRHNPQSILENTTSITYVKWRHLSPQRLTHHKVSHCYTIRPKGGYEAKFSLAPIAPRLTELLGVTVPLVPDCVGAAVTEAVSKVHYMK